MHEHEATITIARIDPIQPNRKTHKVYDTEGGEWSLFPTDRPFYEEGMEYKVGFSSNDFKGKIYRTLKGTPKTLGGAPKTNGSVAPRAVDVGPHRAMWEKEISRLIENGMPEERVPLHVITCRRLAREGLAADLDGKLPEPSLLKDPNDSLEY